MKRRVRRLPSERCRSLRFRHELGEGRQNPPASQRERREARRQQDSIGDRGQSRVDQEDLAPMCSAEPSTDEGSLRSPPQSELVRTPPGGRRSERLDIGTEGDSQHVAIGCGAQVDASQRAHTRGCRPQSTCLSCSLVGWHRRLQRTHQISPSRVTCSWTGKMGTQQDGSRNRDSWHQQRRAPRGESILLLPAPGPERGSIRATRRRPFVGGGVDTKQRGRRISGTLSKMAATEPIRLW